MINNHEHELSIVDKSFTSAASFGLVDFFINFPKRVTGLVILSIGEGCSSSCAELRKRGATAIAIDYRYRNLQDLKKSYEGYLSDHIGMVRGFTKRSTLKYRIDAQNARREFIIDLRTNPGFYISALAGELPIKDESVDLVYSLQCLSAFLIFNPDVFMNACREVFRVLKPGGKLKLQPWPLDDGKLDSIRCLSTKKLMTLLASRHYSYCLERNNKGSLHPCLVVTK